MTEQDDIAAWLIRAGLENTEIGGLVGGFGQRLNRDGIPARRLVVGIFMLHPIYGALGCRWTAGGAVEFMPARVDELATARFQNAPLFELVRNDLRFRRLRPTGESRSEILRQLAEAGTTDYCLFREPFETSGELPAWDRPGETIRFNEGIMGSIATDHAAGFTGDQVERLRWLFSLLCLAIRANSNFDMARSILDTYLGRRSGARVLAGQIKRGDGQIIRAAVMFTDLRGSTAMSERLELGDYLATINRYFDCTAAAVADHGGEVLKFLGDGVLAIFPFDAAETPKAACLTAIDAARDMLHRIEQLNEADAGTGRQRLAIGIGLHASEIAYGNVGTESRLDFTVTGRAVNEAAKLEALCKPVGTPVLASEEFRLLAEDPGLVCVDCDAGDGRQRPLYTLHGLKPQG